MLWVNKKIFTNTGYYFILFTRNYELCIHAKFGENLTTESGQRAC